MQLSQKRKIFAKFFLHFPKKDDPPSSCIFEFTDFEKRGFINV